VKAWEIWTGPLFGQHPVLLSPLRRRGKSPFSQPNRFSSSLTTLMVFFSQAPAGLWAFPFHEDNLWIACGLYRDIM